MVPLLYPMFLCNFSWQFSDTRCTKHCQVENAMKWSCLKAYWLQPPLGWRITFCCNIFFFTRVQWNCQWVSYTWWCSLVWATVKATITLAEHFVLLMDSFGITSSGYQPAKTFVSPRSSPLGTFRENLRFGIYFCFSWIQTYRIFFYFLRRLFAKHQTLSS